MHFVECPACGESGRVGLPRDATVEAVQTGSPAERDREPGTKTRRVRCSSGHDIYVTFRATAAGLPAR